MSIRNWVIALGSLLLLSGCSGSKEKYMQWQKLAFPNSDEITSIQFLNSSYGFVATGRGGLFRTDDGGKSFEQITTNAEGLFEKAYFQSKEIGFVMGKSGLLSRTSDGGKSWSRISVDSTLDLTDMTFLDKKHGWVIGVNLATDAGATGTSTDLGLTWSFENSEYKGFSQICREGDKNLWILGSDAVLYSTDQGSTWEHNANTASETVRYMKFSDIQNGWSVGDQGLLRVSSDGGWSWKAQKKFTEQNLRSVLAPDFSVTYVAGDQFIAATTNHGRLWLLDSVNYQVRFNCLELGGEDIYLGGGGGTLLKVTR